MNIIEKVTWKCMKAAKRRTMVTIFGVILSVAMIAAVSTIAQSFQDLMLRNARSNFGDFEMEFYDVPAKQAEKLVKDSRIKESLISYHDTYAFLKDVRDAQRQYIQLQVYDMEHLHLNALQLVKGTLPRQKDEILLSESFMETSGTAWKIGDSITLPIGYTIQKDGSRSYSQWNSDDATGKSFHQTGERTFRITGIMDDGKVHFGSQNYAFYLPFQGNEGTLDNRYVISFTMKERTASIYEDAQQLAEDYGLQDVQINPNNTLLMFYGINDDNGFMTTITLATGMVALIIMIGSISLIYNAFAISLSQRSRYLGMLASIGATQKQKRSSVFFEAFVIGVIAIPIGVLCGYAVFRTVFLYRPADQCLAASTPCIPYHSNRCAAAESGYQYPYKGCAGDTLDPPVLWLFRRAWRKEHEAKQTSLLCNPVLADDQYGSLYDCLQLLYLYCTGLFNGTGGNPGRCNRRNEWL